MQDETKIPIGTRVRCSNRSQFHDKEGTVIGHHPEFGWNHVLWDDSRFADPRHNGGQWANSALEVIEQEAFDEEALQDRIALLEEAVMFARNIFGEYADMHLAKGPGRFFKAATNLGFAAAMENALQADS